jgi:hypothetical protein
MQIPGWHLEQATTNSCQTFSNLSFIQIYQILSQLPNQGPREAHSTQGTYEKYTQKLKQEKN